MSHNNSGFYFDNAAYTFTRKDEEDSEDLLHRRLTNKTKGIFYFLKNHVLVMISANSIKQPNKNFRMSGSTTKMKQMPENDIIGQRATKHTKQENIWKSQVDYSQNMYQSFTKGFNNSPYDSPIKKFDTLSKFSLDYNIPERNSKPTNPSSELNLSPIYARLDELQKNVHEMDTKTERVKNLKEAESAIIQTKLEEIISKINSIEEKNNDRSKQKEIETLIREKLDQKIEEIDKRFSEITEKINLQNTENMKRISEILLKSNDLEAKISGLDVNSRKYIEEKIQELSSRIQKQHISLQEEFVKSQQNQDEKSKENEKISKGRFDQIDIKFAELIQKIAEIERKNTISEGFAKKYVDDRIIETQQKISKQFSDTENSIANVQELLNAKLDAQAKSLNSRLDSNNQKIENLDLAMKKLEKSLREYSDEQNKISDLKIQKEAKRIDNLDQKIESLAENIEGTTANQDRMITRMKEILENRITEYDKIIIDRENNIKNTIQNQITEYENRHKNFENDINKLKMSLNEYKKESEILHGNIFKNIDELHGKSNSLDKTPVKVLANSEVSEKIIAENTVKIKILEDEFRKKSDAEQSLEKRIKELETVNSDFNNNSENLISIKEDIRNIYKILDTIKTAHGNCESNWRTLDLRINELNLTVLNKTRELQSRIMHLEERFEGYKIMAGNDILKYPQRTASHTIKEEKIIVENTLKPTRETLPAGRHSPIYLREDPFKNKDKKAIMSVSGTKLSENISSKHFKTPGNFELNMSELKKNEEKKNSEKILTKYSDIIDFKGMDFEEYQGPNKK